MLMTCPLFLNFFFARLLIQSGFLSMEMKTFIHQSFTHILNRDQDNMPLCIPTTDTRSHTQKKSTNSYMILCCTDTMLRHCS